MKNWVQTAVGPERNLRDALKIIDTAGTRLALVVDQNNKLLGTLSDGDIRRWLIKGGTIDDPLADVMNRNPVSCPESLSQDEIYGLMKRSGRSQMPLLDASGYVVGLVTVDDLLTPEVREQPVVIMAGGLGSRMGDLTKDTPKPMLKIGNRPILETILIQFRNQGFRRFFVAVNYLADHIVEHFGDGSAFDCEIIYLRETKRMGTAGALSLLPPELEGPIIVTNADLMIKENLGAVVDGHIKAASDVTIVSRDYEVQVPFGVLEERDSRLVAIEEKPRLNFRVIAGVYVLSRAALDQLRTDSYCDMPELLQNCINAGLNTHLHRFSGYWMDVGRVDDFERAQQEYHEVFGP